MADKEKRGSEKLLAAWKARALTEDSIKEIVDALEKSPAKIEGVEVVGGGSPTAVHVSLRYDGDDGPWCGNDILFWLKWHLRHGGAVKPPRILINGIPWPELVRVDLTFGHGGPVEGPLTQPGVQAGGIGR